MLFGCGTVVVVCVVTIGVVERTLGWVVVTSGWGPTVVDGTEVEAVIGWGLGVVADVGWVAGVIVGASGTTV